MLNTKCQWQTVYYTIALVLQGGIKSMVSLSFIESYSMIKSEDVHLNNKKESTS